MHSALYSYQLKTHSLIFYNHSKSTLTAHCNNMVEIILSLSQLFSLNSMHVAINYVNFPIVATLSYDTNKQR
jgi:hypothetical protein